MFANFTKNELLCPPLQSAYGKGDGLTTLHHIRKKVNLEPYRVLVKDNFNTACWVPPVAGRKAHTIYYGTNMLSGTIDLFMKREEIEPFDPEALKEAAIDRRHKKLSADLAALMKRDRSGVSKTIDKDSVKITERDLLNEKIIALNDSLSDSHKDMLSDFMASMTEKLGRHERAHARHTSKDLEKTNRDLKELGIPFIVFNVFEDARIEHLSRMELGSKFNWQECQEFGPLLSSSNLPISLFLRLVGLEGEPDMEALESTDQVMERDVSEMAEVVESYYRRAIICPSDRDLLPLMKDFMGEFKEFFPPDEKSAGGSGSPSSGDGDKSGEDDQDEQAPDLITALEAAEKGETFFEDFEKDATVVGGTDEEGKAATAAPENDEPKSGRDVSKGKGSGPRDTVDPLSVIPEGQGGEASPHNFLARKAGRVSDEVLDRVATVTTMLLRMFKAKDVKVYSEAPNKRLSGRHLARGEIRYSRNYFFGGRGKRRFEVIYDCSGSMSGQPDIEGKIFLLALNNLARQGYLRGNLVLSGWVGGQAGWVSYAFPMPDQVILSINPSHGAEGLEGSIKGNLAQIKGADDVFVYTDANITDAPLDQKNLASNKVWPVGLYVGSKDAATAMQRHFPQNIIEETVEKLIEVMMTRNRRTFG